MTRASARVSPFSKFWRSLSDIERQHIRWLGSQYLASDDQPLDFARAFTDRAEFNVPVEFFSRIFLDETVASMHLNAFVGDAYGDLSGVKLRHGRLCRRLDTPIFHPGRAMRQQARGIDLGGHVCKFELDRLKFRDRLPELFPLLCVVKCRFI